MLKPKGCDNQSETKIIDDYKGMTVFLVPNKNLCYKYRFLKTVNDVHIYDFFHKRTRPATHNLCYLINKW